MKLSLPNILSAFVFLFAAESQAQLKNASLVANCRSLALDQFSGFLTGIGAVDSYVTTYDGSSGFPLHLVLGNGSFYYNSELRPRTGQTGVYEADYVTYNSSGYYVQYGSFTMNLPTTDLDGNGLPDISQKNKSVSAVISGNGIVDWSPNGVTAPFSISGNFSRSANSQTGNYSVTVTTTSTGVSVPYSGTWHVLHVSGGVSYQRGLPNTLNFNLTFTDPVSGTSIGLTGSTFFTVNSANQIALPQFSLTGSDGKTYTINAASTLNRVGNKYIGNWALLDGGQITSWPDYTGWVVEIIDTNDSNGNGIPDLSDPFAIAPASPTSLTAVGGYSSIALAWQDNANNEQSFRIERKTGAGGTWGFYATVGANVTSYNDTGVVAGSTYYYRVYANNSAGNSPYYSNEAFAAAILTVGLPYTFTTLAGSAGQIGSADGVGSAARFGSAAGGPIGVAADSMGNVYVADAFNNTIRKVTAAGAVTTLAGLAGNAGVADGTGNAARFSHPSGVAADGAGNVYVADTDNHTIRKVTPAGVVTTLAGLAGNPGSADGLASARFGFPSGVAVDSAGNIYVADTGNATIRKVTAAGVVTTLAGLAGVGGSADGAGNDARFRGPSSVAVDNVGNVYVADQNNHTIRKMTPSGVVTTLAGLAGNIGSVDGLGTAARFYYPSGVASDNAGNVFVADRFNATIRKVTPAGVVRTLGGLPGNPGSADGTGSAARFGYSQGVAVDSAGNIYIADSNNNTIRKGRDTTPPAVTITSPTAGARLSNSPVSLQGIASDNVGVASVWYQLNSNDWAPANGTTNWMANVNASPGTNTVRAYAMDTSGNHSLTNSVSFVYVLVSPLTLSINGSGTVSPNLNAQNLEVGKSYTMTATPGVGYIFSNWAGGIVASTRSLTFVMQTNLALQVNFIPNPFAPTKGTYSGLFYDTNGVGHGSSGFLTAKTTEGGAFSSTLLMAGQRYSSSGQFTADGKAMNTIPRLGASPLAVELQLDFSGADQLLGRISDGVWVAELIANRTVFNATTNPCPFVGKYTAVIPGSTNGAVSPAGDGFGTVTVNSAGLISLKGALADGTKIVQKKVALSKQGEWPFYVSLYSGKGSILSWITFTNRATDSLNGEGTWIKTSQALTPLYAGGFTNEPLIHGSTYGLPVGGKVLDFTDGVVVLSGGDLTQSWTNTVTLDADNKVVNTSSNVLTMKLTTKTGSFKGSFVEPGTGRKVSFSGALQQKQNAGFGYFLGTSQSGEVRFEAAP